MKHGGMVESSKEPKWRPSQDDISIPISRGKESDLIQSRFPNSQMAIDKYRQREELRRGDRSDLPSVELRDSGGWCPGGVGFRNQIL